MNTDNFSKNLSEILSLLGMSQEEFAKRVGVTPAAISQILNGKRVPSLETIIKILEVLPTTFERLFSNNNKGE